MPHRARLTITHTAAYTEHLAPRTPQEGGDIIRQWRTRGDGYQTVTIYTHHPQHGHLLRGIIRRAPDGGWTFTDADFHPADGSHPDYIDAEDALIAQTSGLDEISPTCPDCRTRPAIDSGLCQPCSDTGIPHPVHHDGDPQTCRPSCPGPHYTDAAPAICPECEGSGKACWPRCTDRSHRYEPGEGRTGADEFYSDYY